jgi:hypothetical protein
MNNVAQYIMGEAVQEADLGLALDRAVAEIERRHGAILSIETQPDPTLTKDGFSASWHHSIAVSVPPGVAKPNEIAERARAAVHALIERLTNGLKKIDLKKG